MQNLPINRNGLLYEKSGKSHELITAFGLDDRPESHLLESYQYDEYQVKLSANLTDALRLQADQSGVDLASLCHLAWGVVLAKYSVQQQVMIGTLQYYQSDCGIYPLFLDIEEKSVRDILLGIDEYLSQLLIIPTNIYSTATEFTALIHYQYHHNSIEHFDEINAPLMLIIHDDDNSLKLTTRLLAMSRVSALQLSGYLQQALQQLVWALSEQPAIAVSQLDILPLAERRLLLETWNTTQTEYPTACCIHHLFEQQVAASPDATALIFSGEKLSYAELNRQANQLAHYLIMRGVVPDSRVALCVEQSLAMVIGLLAILKAGGSYVPLDPDYPPERLSYILADAKPVLVLHDIAGGAALKNYFETANNNLDIDSLSLTDLSQENPDVAELTTHHLAYVIYTSGSTGQPKGVMVEQGNVVNFLLTMTDKLLFSKQEKVLFSTTISFDIVAVEIYLPLINGAAVFIAPKKLFLNKEALIKTITDNQITMIQATPSTYNLVVDEEHAAFKGVKILCGGEIMPTSLVGKLSENSSDIWNLYGPTETAVWSTIYHLGNEKSDRGSSVSIGKPVANTRIYLLDNQQQPVPLGAIGEMYIGGVGVTRGYLNRAELTAERFLADPFNPQPGSRMYRTGDLVRYARDGNIEYIGRNDFQVKIRGFRIELGEIETRINMHPSVLESIVVTTKGERGNKGLVAYIVISPELSATQVSKTLRDYLLSSLPEYMVPAAFVVLANFPLTPNGKLDRKALPAPNISDYHRQAYEAPQGEKEALLTGIWAELLGLERISRHDNFFTLGGNSWLVVQLIGQLRKQEYVVQEGRLFSIAILSEQALLLEKADLLAIPANLIDAACERITPEILPLVDISQADIDILVGQVPGGMRNIQDIYALSPLQERFLFYHLMAQRGDPYQMMLRMAFNDRSSLDTYIDAMQQMINRHDILRTAFFVEGLACGPVQVVLRNAPLQVIEVALSATSTDAFLEQLTAYHTISHHQLVLSDAPLLRLIVAREPGSGRWLAQEVLHHLLADHTTQEIMHREKGYFLFGQGNLLPEAVPFRNLIAHSRQVNEDNAYEAYFRQILADIDEPTVPFSFYNSMLGEEPLDEYYLELPMELNKTLRDLACWYGVSLASLVHLGWGLVLAKSSERQQIVTGTVLLGRMGSDTGAEQSVGLFINFLPLRMDIDEQSVTDALIQTHERLSQLLTYEHIPLTDVQRCSGVSAPAPLFSSLINYRRNSTINKEQPALSNWPHVELLGIDERCNYPITLSVEDDGDSLGLTAQVVVTAPLSAARLCDYVQQALEQLAWALNEQPNQSISHLNVLPPDELALLLQGRDSAQAEDSAGVASYDDNVEYIDCHDHQVKIWGFRTELREIEGLLEAHNGIHQAVVIARNDVGDNLCLVAYFSLSEGFSDENLVKKLRCYLCQHLPPHMIPVAYVVLESLPLMSNGKVDRKALSHSDPPTYRHSHYEQPKNELEEMLAGIWSELFLIDKVGRNDNFFHLGGQSLLVVRFIFRLQKETGFLLPCSSVFKNPVLSDLADNMNISLVKQR
ncbi:MULTISPECIES: non-ribosomal peptide synthetase [Photorhabdus]|uniref:Amino acid adenylation domain-containing protein n=2 Tax=Photorhabdus asymbiotica TaxID=291112 RepID=A0ABX9SIP8_9GAMM|nr:non-ribosomal peptide synthetase [Photorhabdus asymbiotica]RKS57000.1 amino acid adenylation domain-containing protein [Photorhabdus asymbiotica]